MDRLLRTELCAVRNLHKGCVLELKDMDKDEKYLVGIKDSSSVVNGKLKGEICDSTCVGVVYFDGINKNNVTIYGTDGSNWMLFEETDVIYNITKKSVVNYFEGLELVSSSVAN